MAPGSLKKIVRLCVAVVVVWPVTTALAWQIFLVLFSPPEAIGENPDVGRFEIGANAPALFAGASNQTDDAGCDCNPNDMERIEMRVQTDDVNFIGHAYLKMPTFAVGFCTDERNHGLVDYLWPLSEASIGYLRNDVDHGYDYFSSFRACPATLRRLEASIARHAADPYQVGSWLGGRNCATWAADRLLDAGLTPPPGDCPNKMAWSMARVDSVCATDVQVANVRRIGRR